MNAVRLILLPGICWGMKADELLQIERGMRADEWLRRDAPRIKPPADPWNPPHARPGADGRD